MDLAKVREFLSSLPGVSDVHDLHVWSLGATEIALTCHLVTPNGHPGDDMLDHVAEEMHEHFGIDHVTLQAELQEPSAEHLAAMCNH